MTELSQTERMALRRIINLLPAIEKQFGVGEYLDDDKIIKYVQPQPQPVATLCEEVSRFLGTIHDWHTINLGKARLQEALTAERKRAVLVENLIDAARRFYQENDGRYDLLRARLSELDAFDKGAENG